MASVIIFIIGRVFWMCCLKNILGECLHDFINDYIFCGYREQINNVCCCCGFICDVCKEFQENDEMHSTSNKKTPKLDKDKINVELTINPIHKDVVITTPNGTEIRRRTVEV